MPPMAAVVAAEEPEMAAKKAQETIATREMPPVTHPTRESANSTSFLDSPPAVIMSPARKKPGTANIAKLSALLNSFCPTTANVIPGSIATVTTVVIPSAQVIGKPITIPSKNTTIRITGANCANISRIICRPPFLRPVS